MSPLVSPVAPVVPLERVKVPAAVCTLPLPRSVRTALALTPIPMMLLAARVVSSLAWLMPSWFRSRQMRKFAKTLSAESILPS